MAPPPWTAGGHGVKPAGAEDIILQVHYHPAHRSNQQYGHDVLFCLAGKVFSMQGGNLHGGIGAHAMPRIEFKASRAVMNCVLYLWRSVST